MGGRQAGEGAERWAGAAEANFVAWWAAHGAGGVEVVAGAHLTRVSTPVPAALFNPVLCRRLPGGPALHALVGETLAAYAARQRPCCWVTTPGTVLPPPPALEEALAARGLTRSGAFAVMAAELAALAVPAAPPAGCAVVEVRDAATFGRWCATACAAYGLPPAIEEPWRAMVAPVPYGPGAALRHYLALLDGAPAATATVFLDGQTAGLYNVGTLPAARGRGLGGAVSLAALLAARELGYAVAVLQASPMGRPVYRRLGFGGCCAWPRFAAARPP